MRAWALAVAMVVAMATPAGAQILEPTTTSTEPPPETTTTLPATTTTAVVTTTTAAAASTTVERSTTTTVATTSTNPTVPPPEGSSTTTTASTVPASTTSSGGRTLPYLVVLSIGGFLVALVIMGAQFVATRPRRPEPELRWADEAPPSGRTGSAAP